MTKAQLTTLINTIDTGGLNTAQEVRNVLEGIKNEMFNETELIQGVSNSIEYYFYFKKIGNTVFLNGLILNQTNNTLLNCVLGIPLIYKANQANDIYIGSTIINIISQDMYVNEILPNKDYRFTIAYNSSDN